MTDFTPGPWFADGGYIVSEDWIVATVYQHRPDEAAIVEANARLIAHAPELVEALEAFLTARKMSETLDAQANGRRLLAAIRGDA
jgi:hypothetical protein